MRFPAFIISVLVFLAGTTSVAGQQSVEYKVKAAFLYNFARFVQWPAETTQSSPHLNFCIIGDDPFGASIDALENKTIQGRSIVVHRFNMPEESNGCHVLFVSESESGRITPLLEMFTREHGLLTVSDIEGFSKSGGIIELFLQDGKVRFAVNIATAEQVGIDMSSKLLRLATRVEGEVQANVQ